MTRAHDPTLVLCALSVAHVSPVIPPDLACCLLQQLAPVGEDEGAAALPRDASHDLREAQGLARARRLDEEGAGAARTPLAEDRVDRLALVVAKLDAHDYSAPYLAAAAVAGAVGTTKRLTSLYVLPSYVRLDSSSSPVAPTTCPHGIL